MQSVPVEGGGGGTLKPCSLQTEERDTAIQKIIFWWGNNLKCTEEL